jgi:hypothetical protein
MDNLPESRPGFIDAWLDDLLDDYRTYGIRKLFPWFLALFIAIGWGASKLVNYDELWGKPEVAVVFFAAAVTINGLLLALSWGSFGKIYEIAGRPELARYLKEKKLLKTYIFHVDFIHYTQIVALACSGLALLVSVFDLSRLEEYVSIQLIHDLVFTSTIASTMYALRYALGAVTIMQDLVWHSASLPINGAEPGMKVHQGGRS